MKKRLKIAIFHLAFIYSGGGEKLVLQEMGELAKRGYDVTCFTPTFDKSSCYPDIIGKFKIKSIFPGLKKLFRNHESLEIFGTCLLFPFVAHKFKKFDITLGANQPGPWISYLVKKITGVPYIIYLAQPVRLVYPRHIDKDCDIWLRKKSYFLPFVSFFGKWFIRLADKISVDGASAVLANGNYVAGILEKIYRRKVVVDPAGSDLKKPFVNRTSSDSPPYILLTNRHFPQKKFEYAIQAMPSILKKVSDARLIISGNFTEYSNSLKLLVKSLGLAEKVFFTGYANEKEMKSLYQGASVYVYTSPEEDFGMGVIEAMAAGVPVVAWNKGGPSTTIVNGQTGYLIKPYDQKDFAAKIVKLITNRKLNLFMGRQARVHVSKNFTLEKHMDILEKELEKAINGEN